MAQYLLLLYQDGKAGNALIGVHNIETRRPADLGPVVGRWRGFHAKASSPAMHVPGAS